MTILCEQIALVGHKESLTPLSAKHPAALRVKTRKTDSQSIAFPQGDQSEPHYSLPL